VGQTGPLAKAVALRLLDALSRPHMVPMAEAPPGPDDVPF
jgi:hypothetical protein